MTTPFTFNTTAELRAAAGDDATKPIIASITAYNGGPMRVFAFATPVVLDLDGLTIPATLPIVTDHRGGLLARLGEGAAKITAGALFVEARIARGSPESDRLEQLGKSGLGISASVGVAPERFETIRAGETVKVNGRDIAGPVDIVRKGTLREVSLLGIGADQDATATIAAAAHTFPLESDTMSQINGNTGQILAEERKRVRAIDDTLRPLRAKVSDDRLDQLRARAMDGEISTIQLEAEALELLRASRPNVTGVRDDDRRAAAHQGDVIASAALLLAGQREVAEKHLGAAACERAEDLGAHTLLDLCAAACQMQGIYPDNGREGLIRAAFSTASLPVALGKGVEKVALHAFQEAQSTWRAIARIVPLSSFREHDVARLAADTNFERVGPDGELKYGVIGEESSKLKMDTYGRIAGLTRQSIINDDLHLFNDLPLQFGNAATRKIGDLVFEMILANPDDFFHADNANLLTGASAALSVDGLAAAVALLRKQTDAHDVPLNIPPKTLVVPPELESTGRAVLNSMEVERSNGGEPRGNPMRGVAALEVESRLSAASFAGSSALAWYLFGPTSESAVLVGTLNGRDAPKVEIIDAGSEVLGMKLRAFIDFGVSVHEHRAAVKSDGE